MVALALSAMTLSGSSAARFGGDDPRDPGLVWGTPRSIRGDEWRIVTPYIVSQSRLGYPRRSPSGIGGQDLVLVSDIPNNDWSTIFRPYNWPFFGMDLEHAFSLRWWLVALGLLIPAYALMLTLTGRVMLSAGFSAALFLQPFFQWWYFPASLPLAGFPMAALACFIAAHTMRGWGRRILLAGSVYWLVAFGMLLYPPFQVSVAYVIGAVALGWGIPVWRAADPAARRALAGALVLTGAATVGILLLHLLHARVAFAAASGTVYPGNRRSLAGGASVTQVFSGPFDAMLADPRERPFNASESSSFLLVGPWVVLQMLVLWCQRSRRLAPVAFAAAGVLAILMAWALLPLPALVGRLTLLERVPGPRVLIGIGLASMFITFLYLAEPTTPRPPRSARPVRRTASPVMISAVCLAIGAVVATALAAEGLRRDFPAMPPAARILWPTGFGLLVLLVLTRRQVAAVILMVGFGGVMSLPVNPLYRGLPALTGSAVTRAVLRAAPAEHAGTVLSFAGVYTDPMVVASGRPSLNGVNLYPNAIGWRVLDPPGQYTQAWNRYSVVIFAYTGRPGIHIREISEDMVEVDLSPCDPALDRFLVDTIVFEYPPKAACLTEIDHVDFPGKVVRIYRRAPAGGRAIPR